MNPFELPPSAGETIRQPTPVNRSLVLVKPEIEAVLDCWKMRVAIRSRDLSIILLPVTFSSQIQLIWYLLHQLRIDLAKIPLLIGQGREQVVHNIGQLPQRAMDVESATSDVEAVGVDSGVQETRPKQLESSGTE